MAALKFQEDEFLAAAMREEDFTNTPDGSFEPGAETYLKGFYSGAQENDFLTYSLKDLVKLARDFWMFGNRRKPEEILLDVVEATTPEGSEKLDTAIMVIAEDMAFIVDSVVAAVSSFGINVNGLFHPIVRGNRGARGRWLQNRDEKTAIREAMTLLLVPPQNASVREAIKEELIKTLDDVKIINQEFKSLVKSVKIDAIELSQSQTSVDQDEADEGVAFLDWIADGNFVFLGSRRYDYTKSAKKNGPTPDYVNPSTVKDNTFGVLRDHSLSVLRQSNEPSVIASNVNDFIENQPPVTIAKSNLYSRVHRRVRMDYISVKHFDDNGLVIGETRYVGLFTSDAYNRSSQFVPLIRRKVDYVLDAANVEPDSHNYNRLKYVLESYPRDELFQIGHEDLLRISTGIARTFDRPRTRLFVRRDPFDRFVSALVYVPKEHYNPRVRERIGERLKEAFGGRISAFYPQYSDVSLARVHFIIGMDPDEGLDPDLTELQQQIAIIVKPWFNAVSALAEEEGNDDVSGLINDFKDAFPLAYQETYSAPETLHDVMMITSITEDTPLALRVYESSNLKDGKFKAKLYHFDKCLEPSSVIPMFANFGCDVVQETAYPVRPDGQTTVWVHDFTFRISRDIKETDDFGGIFARAFTATWSGRNEDDGFNCLILPQGREWRDIAFLRLLSRYRRQSGLDPSEQTQIEALDRNPDLTKLLLDLKHAKLGPEAFEDWAKREKAVEKLEADISHALNTVKSIEHDRVIRRLAESLSATLRTNFYQTDQDGKSKPYISVKLDSQAIESLPAPKPYREIYVSSPIVEGVHLRFGPVARGGLRWSDRRDDFRTEVLGLVKAQQVKNAVIVPVGSKGGFFPKNLPENGSRDEVREAGVKAYKTFIRGLLDLTDNYKGEDTVSPEHVICWDKPDPYLVVAADKGTATFSDIANGISQEYGFWLDDAFASGGSAGYDHKVMGITARGGWEAVKRHFRETGKDIQTEDFTVIGVGDMSGDVFGNGMLLSKHIKLLAAFNHMHIFIDPNPDPATSFKERQRLFKKDRSTWEDYNSELISKGGGVFSRASKSIELSNEIKKLTELSKSKVTPDELINALLKSETDLLWFGGIGTYVKSSRESNNEAGDKANEALRVNGKDLKALVIGEGANLGVTQAGRIEYAKLGGRINTDAIDNSAGVDSSDNEVNIKILLSGAIETKALKADKRNDLLADMTDDVAELVLQHNYDQTGMLSLAEFRAVQDHNAYERLMGSLEKRGELDRDVEGLPGSETMQALAAENKGLTRPEIAVLMAYAKNVLFEDIIDTDVADDPFMNSILLKYFPSNLEKFDKALDQHRLRREVITSRLVNKIIDVGGAVFPMRLQEQSQESLDAIAKSFVVAYETLSIGHLRDQIAALDNKVDARAQIKLHNEIARVIQRVTAWLVRRNETGSITDRIDQRSKLKDVVDSDWLTLLSDYDRERAQKRIESYQEAGIPEDLAVDVALLRSRASGFDVVELSKHTEWSLVKSAELFYDIGGRLKIDRVRAALLSANSKVHWERLAMRHIQEDFFKAQAKFALDAAEYQKTLSNNSKIDIPNLINAWIEARIPNIRAYEDTVRAITRSGGWTVAKFAIVNAQLSDLQAGL